MKLICFSVSFHKASLESREILAFSEAQQRKLLGLIQNSRIIHEGMVLCTCNRTELYLYLPADADEDKEAEGLVRKVQPKSLAAWRKYHQKFAGPEAVGHLFAVAAGLDSQMIGEHQIISQLKAAYSAAIEEKTTRFFFHRLMHRAFRASKAVRTQTSLQSGSVSIAAAAIERAGAEMNLPGAEALLVGAGENAELIGRLLRKAGISKLTILSRTIKSAQHLAAALKFGEAAGLDRLAECLRHADLAVFSTASAAPIVTVADCAYFLGQRDKPIVMIDTAVPRDVEPAIGELEPVKLFNLDDLNEHMEGRRAKFEEQIGKAAEIIEAHAVQFGQWLDSLSVSEVIAEMLDKYTKLAGREAKRYGRHFRPEDAEELEQFARKLVKKVLHGPITYLKESDEEDMAADQLQAVDLIRKVLLSEPEGERKR